MWIGIDDTDSAIGGCTTYVLYQLVGRLCREGFGISGYPRLVRLNPNVPWKTRGNGAVALHVDMDGNASSSISDFFSNEVKIDSIQSTMSLGEKKDRLFQLAIEVIETYAQLKEGGTNPGLVLSDQQLSEQLYWDAVQGIVKVEEVRKMLSSSNAVFKEFNSGRGLIGASAALAWRPSDTSTYEYIAYRERHQWGLDRAIDERSVKDLDRECPDIFDSYDAENNSVCIAPHSPCPVLYGTRGVSAASVRACRKRIISEKPAGWLLFLSNQATDDHLHPSSIHEVKPFESAILDGIVKKRPWVITGGHVLFSLMDPDQDSWIDCAAYEPTKQFREVIKALYPGDHVVVYGGVRQDPLTVNVEKIEILSLVKVTEKIENPVCDRCGKHMKSIGKEQGYRCRDCGTKSDQAKLRMVNRSIEPGLYEVPVVARRHLSRPLKLINQKIPQ